MRCFFSLQGEGIRAGTANVFVRFAGCNLKCDIEPGPLSPGGWACDTEFSSGRKVNAGELEEWIIEESDRGPREEKCWNIIFTGGEPGLQLDPALIQYFKERGYYLAIETNGTVQLPEGLNWICVSPKVAEHAIRQRRADEVKYVRHYGQEVPKTVVDALYYLLSPATGPEGIIRRNLEWCIHLVKKHPQWRLSVQQHKTWGVR